MPPKTWTVMRQQAMFCWTRHFTTRMFSRKIRVQCLTVQEGDTAATAISRSTTTIKLKASEGYRDGTNDYVTHTDANDVATNIKDGVTIRGLTGTLKRNYSDTTLSVTGTLLERQTSEPYSGFWKTASIASNNITTITGLTKGFYYLTDDVSNNSYIPFYSSMYGYGTHSGLQIVSVATGEKIALHNQESKYMRWRAIMAELVGTTTLRVIFQWSFQEDDEEMGIEKEEKTVSSNFFSQGVYLRDYIDIAYSNSSSFVYKCQNTLHGKLYKF